VLILDDLHWADGPTLSLLRHVVTAGPAMRVLVVGTYRDSDLSREHPLTALLADLHREQGVQRMKLTGLDGEDMLALMEVAAGHELDENGRALAAEIARETAGNPIPSGSGSRASRTGISSLLNDAGSRSKTSGSEDQSAPIVATLAKTSLPVAPATRVTESTELSSSLVAAILLTSMSSGATLSSGDDNPYQRRLHAVLAWAAAMARPAWLKA
jgi:hypothetical protein